jgi:monoamine oxidase
VNPLQDRGFTHLGRRNFGLVIPQLHHVLLRRHGVTGLTAEGFDDGRMDVPVGAAEPVERVVVIGAGIAGLTAALAHGGVECVVVEARDRIGGRLHTVNLAGSPVDLGGSWIHTPVGNPMRTFAQQAGIPEAPAVWAIGQDAFGVGPVLVFQIFHSATSHILDATADDAAQWALDILAEATGSSCPAPAAVAVTSWANDPYSGGACTHIPPGANPADADLLGEPIGGRLLFAGAHTQSARMAYADGAMTSGIREAKRLLGQPSVHLGPILTTHR